jgi:hypothetical protein
MAIIAMKHRAYLDFIATHFSIAMCKSPYSITLSDWQAAALCQQDAIVQQSRFCEIVEQA